MVPLLITSKSSCVNSFCGLCWFFYHANRCVWTSPCFASRLHVIGQCDIVWPHVKLPLPQSQHATVDTPTVNADAHVYVDPRHFSHQPAGTQHRRSASITSNKQSQSKQHTYANTVSTHEMASIMSTPISTQQWAWSARGSGSPDTQ